MKINCIVAVSQNGVIGNNGQIPWHRPEDLKRFKELTMGYPVIMGRKTFESIGKPLKGRKNIVVTRSDDFNSECVIKVNSIKKALANAKDFSDEVFIIGGSGIYEQTQHLWDRVYLTVVGGIYEGDAKFDLDWIYPEFGRTFHVKEVDSKSDDLSFYELDRIESRLKE